MPIECKPNRLILSALVDMEEAEPLRDALEKKPRRMVDLSACTHIHAAGLQVLMAAQPTIQAWPVEQDLRVWLRTSLESGGTHR